MARRKPVQKQADAETSSPAKELIGYFESPESSTIASASYDQGTMTVWFKRGPGRDNERYDYGNIPEDVWERFVAADSKGHFFSTQIRPHYAGKAVTTA